MDAISSNLLAPNLPASASGASKVGVTPQQIEAVGTDFEGVFLSMMIKEMRKSLDNGGFFAGESSDTYGGMFDMFIGKHLAQTKPLGISDMMVQQYQKHAAATQATGENADGTATSTTA